jgi:hypothetical protein
MTLGQFYKIGAKDLLQQVAHKQCPVPWLEHSANWPLSSFLGAHPLKIIGLSSVPPDCPVSLRCNGQLHQRSTTGLQPQSAVPEVRRQSTTSGRTGLSGVPPNYPVQQKDKRLQRSTAPNSNGLVTWHAPDSEQYCVRCAHR